MPYGKGTYGSKVGRPPKKIKKVAAKKKKLTKKKITKKKIRGTPKKAKEGLLATSKDYKKAQKNQRLARQLKTQIDSNPRISDRDLQIINNIYSKDYATGAGISDQDIKTLKRFIK